MTRISYFFGIVITMYWRERDHPVPHFHASYGGQQASVDIDGNVLGDTLPPPVLRLVREWAGLHHDELLASWNRARDHKPLRPIDPLL